jgi:hypothetical protein
MKKKKERTLNEYRQTASIDSNKVTKNYDNRKPAFPIPKYDPYTGEKNPHYEELTKDETVKLTKITSENAIDIINQSKWIESECNNVKRFQFGDFPEVIYVIKTGFKDRYMVVYEDAYELTLGETKIMTKELVEKTFEIKLSF